MSRRINPEHLVPIAAVALSVLVVAACAIQLRNDEGAGPIRSPVTEETDPFAAKLEHCRTVTSEQPVELENCRHVWAENRRRFFTSTKPRWDGPPDGKPAEPAPSAKSQDRVLPPEISRGQSEVR